MSAYLGSGDYATYGLPGSVTAAQVFEASSYVDSYLRRPEGMVWMPDYAGNPIYMAALTPALSLTLTAPIAPGQNVTASVTPPYNTADTIGEVFIAGRETAAPGFIGANICEALVANASTPGTITFAEVTQPHAEGALLEAGLLVLEDRPMLRRRSLTRITRTHPVRMVSGLGRFGYGRFSDVMEGTYNEVNLLATLTTFGGPPQWLQWDVSQGSLSPQTGELWVPASVLLAYFTDVRVRYVAGFAANAIPDPIKRATARVIQNMLNLPPAIFGGLTRRVGAGGFSTDRLSRATPGRGAGAGETVLDQNAMALIDPYKCRQYF